MASYRPPSLSTFCSICCSNNTNVTHTDFSRWWNTVCAACLGWLPHRSVLPRIINQSTLLVLSVFRPTVRNTCSCVTWFPLQAAVKHRRFLSLTECFRLEPSDQHQPGCVCKDDTTAPPQCFLLQPVSCCWDKASVTHPKSQRDSQIKCFMYQCERLCSEQVSLSTGESGQYL